MERLRFRSTSVVDIEAELREGDLLASNESRHRPPESQPGRTVLGLRIGPRRPRVSDRR
jgi:hypothetical protein